VPALVVILLNQEIPLGSLAIQPLWGDRDSEAVLRYAATRREGRNEVARRSHGRGAEKAGAAI